MPSDIKLAWMECGIPDCATLGGPLEKASDYWGWDQQKIDIGLTPEEVKAGWERAVRAQPDAVVATGFPRVIFDQELATLAAEDTKVMAANGQVVSVDVQIKNLVVQVDEEGEKRDLTFSVDQLTKIQKDGRMIALTEVKSGDKVHVSYHNAAGKSVATAIDVRAS